MSDHYILNGTEPVKTDLMTWARWFETADRRVAKEQIGTCWVSTVFLGLDHSFGGGAPLLFETMVFPDGDGFEAWSDQCGTYADALKMHERGCQFARETQSAARAIIDRTQGIK